MNVIIRDYMMKGVSKPSLFIDTLFKFVGIEESALDNASIA